MIIDYEYFNLKDATCITTIIPNSKVHVIGVSGVAMAQISIELSNRGYTVSGSDIDFYEPMGSLLRKSSVSLLRGYTGENIPSDVSLVVIGNSIRRDNPEVLEALERKLPYTIFPKLYCELGINGKHSIVVSGTHGKSTTTGIIASILKIEEESPSYFVGGVISGFNSSLQCGFGNFAVSEGDEYDSSFFAKLPKFHFYKPNTLIITSIEFDHADIYKDLQAVEQEFLKLVDSLDERASVIACTDCVNIKRLVDTVWQEQLKDRLLTYGLSNNAEYKLQAREFINSESGLKVQEVRSDNIEFKIPLLGLHNAKNALAAYLACRAAGIATEIIKKGFLNYRGVKRRQEIVYSEDNLIVMDDFAHHPTAVKETLNAIKEAYNDRYLICAFEPRSNTSRRRVFQEAYKTSFISADAVILSKVAARPGDEGIQLFSVEELAAGIIETEKDKPVFVSENSEEVVLKSAQLIQDQILKCNKNILFVTMSNGAFGGVSAKIAESFKR